MMHPIFRLRRIGASGALQPLNRDARETMLRLDPGAFERSAKCGWILFGKMEAAEAMARLLRDEENATIHG